MLAVDLLLHREAKVISSGGRDLEHDLGRAGLAFGIVLLAWQGGEASATYYSGILIEKALSVDNVFVFALIFTAFAVPAELQHRVLFYGVMGALVFRFAFIFVGAELLARFSWTAYRFGAFSSTPATRWRSSTSPSAPAFSCRSSNPRAPLQVEPVAFAAATFAIARSWIASPVESKSVMSSAERRPSASPLNTRPMSVTRSRVTTPASTPAASSPPWDACSKA